MYYSGIRCNYPRKRKMKQNKIVIPLNEKNISTSGVIRLSDEALKAVSIISNKTGWSIKKTASMIIEQAYNGGLIQIEGSEEDD